jgi:hypothetical protein
MDKSTLPAELIRYIFELTLIDFNYDTYMWFINEIFSDTILSYFAKPALHQRHIELKKLVEISRIDIDTTEIKVKNPFTVYNEVSKKEYEYYLKFDLCRDRSVVFGCLEYDSINFGESIEFIHNGVSYYNNKDGSECYIPIELGRWANGDFTEGLYSDERTIVKFANLNVSEKTKQSFMTWTDIIKLTRINLTYRNLKLFNEVAPKALRFAYEFTLCYPIDKLIHV